VSFFLHDSINMMQHGDHSLHLPALNKKETIVSTSTCIWFSENTI